MNNNVPLRRGGGTMRLAAAIVILSIFFISNAYADSNSVCRKSFSEAKDDIKKELIKKYDGHYSTIEMLLNANMDAYQNICNIPESDVSNKILDNLNNRYYPHFSTIYMLYKSNIESYRKLNQ